MELFLIAFWLLVQQCLHFSQDSDWEQYLPLFAIFFPVEIAIALTALVHLANNLFKLALVWKAINKKVFMLFALPALITALFGAMVLNLISREIVLYTYNLAGNEFEVTLLRFVVSFLLVVFALIELDRRFDKFAMGKRFLPLGGALSGFFGGLSGHQGALRSMFLLRAGLSKEGFIATGIAAATLIDISRLSPGNYAARTTGSGFYGCFNSY